MRSVDARPAEADKRSALMESGGNRDWPPSGRGVQSAANETAESNNVISGREIGMGTLLAFLIVSTYLRDGFTPNAIAADGAGNVYVAGTSQRTVLVVKLDAQASRYLFTRYIGGSVKEAANAITVDAAGNVYVAGWTESPDFPVTNGTAATAAGPGDPRSFVLKLDAKGLLVFSTLLGGSAASNAQAIAVAPSGRVIVSGTVVRGLFPSTPGAYSIQNTAGHPYLVSLDATGSRVFSATGIGGSALAVDAQDNIYVAGYTYLLDYPTTPGAYQTTFPAVRVCSVAPCSGGGFQAANQYVTKVDKTGSTLIYSTAVTGRGNTTNSGMTVDSSGNVYLTGYAGPGYPYTVTAPVIPIGPVNGIFFFELPFLTKLDAAGRSLVFSVPVGGAGVQVDGKGNVYVGGGVGAGVAASGFGIPNNVPALAGVANPCLPDNHRIRSVGYVSAVDAGSGETRATRFVGGSTLSLTGLAASGSRVWVTGTTARSDVPLTPGALTLPNLPPTQLPGAYLGAIDFSDTGAADRPQVFCIVDSADLTPVAAVAPNQLLTMFGTGLGPQVGVAAEGDSPLTLGGVSIDAGSASAPLLYVSSNQINFATPLVDYGSNFAALTVRVDGAAADSRLIPLTFSNPSLFVDQTKAAGSFGATAYAENANGSVNSESNPVKLGETVSVFVNGLVRDPRVISFPVQLASTNGWSVERIEPASPYVQRVTLRTPAALVNQFACSESGVCAAEFSLFELGPVSNGHPPPTGEAFGGVVYVDRGR